jgi:hypothetical protein
MKELNRNKELFITILIKWKQLKETESAVLNVQGHWM